MEEFSTNLAVIVGIDRYENGIPALETPVEDATALAEVLRDRYGYEVWLRVAPQQTEGPALLRLLEHEIPDRLARREDTRLLFYYAGHGIALENVDRNGPEGFLIPRTATQDQGSFLPMARVFAAFSRLPCRHFLTVLDCCFAGAFRWAATRDVVAPRLKLYEERYLHFLRHPAWQVITSAAQDERALDIPAGRPIGVRETGIKAGHSPFASALLAGLAGAAAGDPARDGGIVTASGLYAYLLTAVGAAQTPRSWPLPRHGRGEFVFRDRHRPLGLARAAAEIVLDEANNPYRGLEPYRRLHGSLFFGREAETARLEKQVLEQRLTAVVGPSGSGKSSLMRAGLAPRLEEQSGAWRVLGTCRPGSDPWGSLARVLAPIGGPDREALQRDPAALGRQIEGWLVTNPESHLVLLVDQLEELLTLTPREAEPFLALLADPLRSTGESLARFHAVVTLRSDFEPALEKKGLADLWPAARFLLRPMTQDELRDAIEKPAAQKVLFFDDPAVVDDLINEVVLRPGALPLLSFTLSEMYRLYLEDGRGDRTLTAADYRTLGGVVGSLRRRADAEYRHLPDDAHRQTLERLLLRMVDLQAGERARRRVFLRELDYPDLDENLRVDLVLSRLTAARLILEDAEPGVDGKPGEPYAEPAHEALLTAWDRLGEWIERESVDPALQRRVTQASDDWIAGHEDRELLWADDPRLHELYGHRGLRWWRHRLRAALSTIAPPLPARPWINRRELRFLEASYGAWQSFQVRLWLSVLLVLAATAGAALFFYFQNRENLRLRFSSITQRLAEQVPAELAGNHPKRALLLARQAYNEERWLAQEFSGRDGDGLGRRVDEALRRALEGAMPQSVAVTPSRTLLPQPLPTSALFSPKNPHALAVGRSDGSVDLWDLRTGTSRNVGRRNCHPLGANWSRLLSASLGPVSDAVADLAWVSGGTRLRVFTEDGQIWDIDPASRADPPCDSQPVGGRLCRAAVSPDQQWLALLVRPMGGSAVLSVEPWGNPQAGEPLDGAGTRDRPCDGAAAFHPSGTQLVGAVADTLGFWEPAPPGESGRRWRLRQKIQLEGQIASIAFSQDGRWLAAGGSSGTRGYLWLRRLGPEGFEPKLRPVDSAIEKIAFDPADPSLRLAANTRDGKLRVWNLPPAANEEPVVLESASGALDQPSLSADGERLATLDRRGEELQIWELRIDELARAACRIAGANLSWDEWTRYVGLSEPYQRTCPHLAIHPSVLTAGDNLVLAGDGEGALRLFRHLAEIQPSLGLDPAGRAAAVRLRQKFLAGVKVDLPRLLASLRMLDTVEAQIRRQKIEPLPFDQMMRLCRWTALLGEPARSLPACDRAVAIGDPKFAYLAHDSRGIARALTGNLDAAAHDFEQSTTLEGRAEWAQALRQKQNPLTPHAIQAIVQDELGLKDYRPQHPVELSVWKSSRRPPR